jgi:hypothetical protein
MTTDDQDGGGDVDEGAPTVDFTQYRARRKRLRLFDLLDALIIAMERRDLQAVWDVLDEEEALRAFPAGVREEALMMARLPVGSLRAPLRTYQFYHQLQQLADETLSPPGDPSQLVLDLTSRREGPPDLRRSG